MAENNLYPVAQTLSGKVKGELRDGIAIFHGIPYGGDMGGANRFMAPTPVTPWEGVRDCTKNGHIAVQTGASIADVYDFGPFFSGGHPERFGVYGEEMGEDCLILNVLTPGIDDKKRPVLVYIHGGGYSSGSGTTVLGGDRMCSEQDVVLVGITHRLNVFGYMYLGAFDEKYKDSGNAGMLDLVQALEWVRDNIAAFGGDPEKVTIFGESGGGGKVSTLANMPAAKGLFRGAVVESGSIGSRPIPKEAAAKYAESFLFMLGMTPDDLSKLETLPTSYIFNCANNLRLRLGPVADGINLPEDVCVYDSLDPNVVFVVGSSEDEVAAFASEKELKISSFEEVAEMITKGNRFGGDSISIEKAREIVEKVRALDTKNSTPDHIYFKIRSMCGVFGKGAFDHTMNLANQGVKVYHYLTRYDAPDRIVPGKKYSWHVADVPYQMRIVLHPEDEEHSKDLCAMICAFARTQNPSIPGVDWPLFTADKRETLINDDVFTIESDPCKPYREIEM